MDTHHNCTPYGDAWTLLQHGFVWHPDAFELAAKVVHYMGCSSTTPRTCFMAIYILIENVPYPNMDLEEDMFGMCVCVLVHDSYFMTEQGVSYSRVTRLMTAFGNTLTSA